jgi:glycerophosphoryl diester phosphodiesterase
MHTVQVIAHRGASAYAPESTIAAFDLALDMGADALETDVRMTSDDIPVLCHDATVDRISDGQGEVAAMTIDQLKRLDFGVRFAPEFAGQRILTVAEFLDRYGARLPLVLEIKAEEANKPLCAMVRRWGLIDQTTFTSFNDAWLRGLHRLDPQLEIGLLTKVFDDKTIQMVKTFGFRQICPPAADVDAALVLKAQRSGLSVRAWGVSSDDLHERALQAGVDGMTTNWPDRLIARLLALGWR